MRKIDCIVLHCTATKAGQKVTTADIEKWHKARGFNKIGYHYVIYLDGSIHTGRELAEVGAHVTGHNADSVGICYVGGLDAAGKPADTRTPEQKAAMFYLLQSLREQFPGAKICGHRDFPGVAKACPCFDAISEYKNI